MKGDQLRGRRGGTNKQGSDHGIIASTRHLTRILIVLKDSKELLTYTQIKEYTGITGTLADALRWLVNHELINKGAKGASPNVRYSIK